MTLKKQKTKKSGHKEQKDPSATFNIPSGVPATELVTEWLNGPTFPEAVVDTGVPAAVDGVPSLVSIMSKSSRQFSRFKSTSHILGACSFMATK